MLERSMPNYGSISPELDFDQPVINIGSHPENDIKIIGQGILPFHAMLVLQDGGIHLVPLSPQAQISACMSRSAWLAAQTPPKVWPPPFPRKMPSW
jgi:hypothetical protein